jgi:hypothetical protein
MDESYKLTNLHFSKIFLIFFIHIMENKTLFFTIIV